MGFTVAGQTWVFLGSLLVGALLGLLYDIFRITRLALPLPAPVVFCEDLCFCLLAAAATFSYLLMAVEGQLRFFVLLGEGLGWALYRLTLGVAVMGCAAALIRLVKRLLRLLDRLLVRPVLRLGRWLARPWMDLFRQIRALAKKQGAAARFRLKQQRILLYNLKKKPAKGKFRLKRSQKGGGADGQAEEA